MSKIKITFPDGAVKEFDNCVTGFQIAQSISNRLADEVLAVKFIAFYEQFEFLQPFFANVVEALVY